MGVRILKTPVRAPKANAFCERLVGTIRREYLDFLIPFGERHLKRLLAHWFAHYNHARVHTSLGPGIPDPIRPSPPMSDDRHCLPAGHVLRSKAVLGGLHHEYWLEKALHEARIEFLRTTALPAFLRYPSQHGNAE